MKRVIFTLFATCIVTTTISQTKVFKQKVKLNGSLFIKKEAYPIVDQQDNATILLLDADDINAYKFNSDFEITDSIGIKRPPEKFKQILTHKTDSEGYQLLFSRKNKKSFCLYTFNYNDEPNIITLSLPSKEERFLEAFNTSNRIFILSVPKLSAYINLYEVSTTGLKLLKNFKTRIIYGTNGERYLDEALSKGMASFQHQYIDNSLPNPLELTSKSIKLYSFANKIVITFDNSNTYTKALIIDTEKLEIHEKFIKTKLFIDDENEAKANSYVYNNIIFQLKVNKEQLWMAATHLETDSILNEFNVKKNSTIAFKNSKLIQHNDDDFFSIERELNKTKQVLRKMYYSNVGVSIYEKSYDRLVLKIGAHESINKSNLNTTMTSGIPNLTITKGPPNPTFKTAPASFYPLHTAWSSYKSSKSVYFRIMLHKQTLKHIKGMTSKNPLERIAEYDDNQMFISSETIFKCNNNYYYGYYNSFYNEYIIEKYTN